MSPSTSPPSVRALALALLEKPRLAAIDVDTILRRAMEDGRLTSRARGHIRSVIDHFEAQDESKEAVARLRAFLDIRRDALHSTEGAAEKDSGAAR